MQNDRSSRPVPQLGNVRPEWTGGPRSPAPRGGLAPPPPRRPTRFDAPPRRRFGLGRIALYAGLAVVTLVVGGLAVMLFAPPVALVRSHVIAEVERQTGRKLTIGSARLTIASGLGVALGEFSLSSPPTMSGGSLLSAERVEVQLALLPLIVREIRIERLTLYKAQLALTVDDAGRRNWDFADLGTPRSAQPLHYAQIGGRASDAGLPAEIKDFMRAASPPGAGGAATRGSLGLDGLSLGDVRIVDGRARYDDATTGARYAATGIDATLALASIGGPLTLRGQMTVGGERVDVDARLDQFRDVLAQRPSNVRLVLDGPNLSARYEGKLAGGALPSGDGRASIKTPSAAALARWLQLPVAGLEGVGALRFDGSVQFSGAGGSIASASFGAGASTGTGSASVDLAGGRPRITANLQFARLDLASFGGIGVGVPAAASETAGPRDGTPGRFAPPASIDDLLQRDDSGGPTATPPPAGPRVRGFRQRAGNQWDVEAINATALRMFDLDGRFVVDSLTSGPFEAAKLRAAVEVKDGVLRASVTDGEAAGGKVRGLASLDARQAILTLGVNVSGDGVALGPLLAGSGVLVADGRTKAVVTVSARGGSERELISTLAGKADVRIVDGALIGWDADQIIAALGRGQMPATARQSDARTPFRELSATFQIADGVARTRDLKLDSATVQASGTGLVNIVDRNVDFTLKPRIAQGGLEVPVRVAGPWDTPSLVPDLAGALNSPQAQDAMRHLKDGNVDGALRSVLGGGAKADKQIDKAKDFLKGLFKQ